MMRRMRMMMRMSSRWNVVWFREGMGIPLMMINKL
jgi:hypothetical protein